MAIYRRLRKFGRKVFKRAGRYIKKRYFKGKGYGSPRIGQMSKDLSFVKSMINAEKKRFNQVSSNILVGQINANFAGGGFHIQDITPTPGQGTSYSTRNGDSIKWSSSHMKFQVTSQLVGNSNSMKFKGMVVQVLGAPQAINDIVPNLFVGNKWINNSNSGLQIYDSNSEIDPDYFGQYRIVRRFSWYLPVSQTASTRTVKTYTVGLKLNNGKGHHVRFQQNSNTVTDGQYVLIIFADSGNISGTTSSIVTAPILTGNTGASVQMDLLHYYYDN